MLPKLFRFSVVSIFSFSTCIVRIMLCIHLWISFIIFFLFGRSVSPDLFIFSYNTSIFTVFTSLLASDSSFVTFLDRSFTKPIRHSSLHSMFSQFLFQSFLAITTPCSKFWKFAFFASTYTYMYIYVRSQCRLKCEMFCSFIS